MRISKVLCTQCGSALMNRHMCDECGYIFPKASVAPTPIDTTISESASPEGRITELNATISHISGNITYNDTFTDSAGNKFTWTKDGLQAVCPSFTIVPKNAQEVEALVNEVVRLKSLLASIANFAYENRHSKEYLQVTKPVHLVTQSIYHMAKSAEEAVSDK